MAITQIPGPSAKLDVFTSSGSWVCPSNVTVIDILAVGGGGGGGSATGSATQACSAGGGGGAQVIRKKLSVTPGTTYTVTIGAGGSGSTSTTTAGGSGGSTTFANGATTLIESRGGGGGSTRHTGGSVGPGAYGFNGGGSYILISADCALSGAGGASGNYASLSAQSSTVFNYEVAGVGNNYGTKGTYFDITQANDAEKDFGIYCASRGGIEGFGGSGAGSFAKDTAGTSTALERNLIGVDGGGSGVVAEPASQTNGNNGAANTGGGGSGGASSSTTLANGGNGGSGRLEIGYVA